MEHRAIRQMITKWLGDQNVEILGPWPGILIPLIICSQSSRGGWTNKNPLILTNSKKWLWQNGLLSVRIWPRRWLRACPVELQRSWKSRANTANTDSLHKCHVIVNKSLWNIWSACNYISVHHRNNCQQRSKSSLAANFVKTIIFVSFSKRLATTVLVTYIATASVLVHLSLPLSLLFKSRVETRV